VGVKLTLSTGEVVITPSGDLEGLGTALRDALASDRLNVADPAMGGRRMLNPHHVVALKDYPITRP